MGGARVEIGPMASRSARTLVGLLGALMLMAAAGIATAQSEPQRRDAALPGLPPLYFLVDPSEAWHEQALASLERARSSFVIVQNSEHLDWPPLSGFLIGSNHVVTAHLSEITPGQDPPRYRIRFIDGQVRESVQVAGWREHDFGVLELERPIDLPPMEFGDEAAMRRGDIVLSIGNPSSAARTGLAVTTVGRFLEVRGPAVRLDISTTSGGSGGPVLDLDGRLISMSSFGLDIAIVDIRQLTVSELELRNSIPVDRGGGEAGVAASVMRRLTAEYQR